MVDSILVVGGGSAGWITANLLHARIRRTGRATKVTLVESPDIPTIGVGEATVPSIRRTMANIGIREQDVMASADATFKTLIRFIDWNEGEVFDHPFDRRPRPQSDAAAEAWTAQNGLAFDRHFSILTQISDENLAPKAPQHPEYQAPFPYAYHLDAIKLANRLSVYGREKGIDHKLANVTDVNISSEGLIKSVSTHTGEELSADLYVDCTGFRSALLGEALGVGKRSFKQHLLCDAAVTMQVPFDVHRPEQILTYTKATAREAGWQWDINLQTRRGIGYVYGTDFQTADEAEQVLRAAEGAHSDGLVARHIKFESAKRYVSWKGNCVAVGLSDGFLEPLESSGLYVIEFAGLALASMVEDYAKAPGATVRYFNKVVNDLYDEILGYLNLHYVTSTRRDTPFWQAATADERIVDSLRDRLELWRHRAPNQFDLLGADRLFGPDSYEFLLHGMHWVNGPVKGAPKLPDQSAVLGRCRKEFPKHEVFLDLLKRAVAREAQA